MRPSSVGADHPNARQVKKEYTFHLDLGIEFLFHSPNPNRRAFRRRSPNPREKTPMANTSTPEAGVTARSPYRGPANLSGKIAIVTGGTQGLGEAIARLFGERGAAGLVICGRNAKGGERVASDISSAGCPTVFVQADLANVADCRKVVAKADERFGRVDALVNAAALADRGDIFDTTEERYNEIFDVNVRAPFFLIQETVRIMRREKIAGSIVNIQSMSAHGGQPFITAYCASKGALATLTRNVAHSLLKFRIRINGLNIGWMSTPGEDHIQKTYHGARDGWLDEAVKTRPFGRLLDPKEVARACVYLCSDESGLITGSNIDFDQNVVGTGDPPLEP
jgi:NAD(P)-dependent dehydrogenase (short-subunit alcohol dehydrogenase family)